MFFPRLHLLEVPTILHLTHRLQTHSSSSSSKSFSRWLPGKTLPKLGGTRRRSGRARPPGDWGRLPGTQGGLTPAENFLPPPFFFKQKKKIKLNNACLSTETQHLLSCHLRDFPPALPMNRITDLRGWEPAVGSVAVT